MHAWQERQQVQEPFGLWQRHQAVKIRVSARTTVRRTCILVGLLAGVILNPRLSHAQYSANFQTNIISGVTSNWTGSYFVGNTTFADVLLVQNGGVLSNFSSSVGRQISASNNIALVTGDGSVWNSGTLYVGFSGSGNSLIISNGGRVFSAISVALYSGYVGHDAGTRSNRILVTGPGSIWSNSTSAEAPFAGIVIGNGGTDHSMTIADGGEVFSAGAIVGLGSSSNNSVRVTGTSSLWNNTGTLDVGHFSNANSLVITNGGKVVCEAYPFRPSGCAVYGGTNNTASVVDSGVWQCNGTLSFGGCITGYGDGLSNSLSVAGGSVFASNLTVCCGNLVQLDAGSVILTNASTNATLDVRGKFVLNGGMLLVDRLVMTDGCAQFIHTGGTIIAGSVVLDPNTFRIMSIVRQGNGMLVTWMMGPGITNTLQVTSGDTSGNYNTNGFVDIFVVTNNAMAGTVTNYLDTGAATNGATRYYRARLIP